MFFPELDTVARKHLDLSSLAEKLDERLAKMSSSAVLRPSETSFVLGANEHQVQSVFDLLVDAGVLDVQQMVECQHCQNLMGKDEYEQAKKDDEEFECSSCGLLFDPATFPIVVYRLSNAASSRMKDSVDLSVTEPVIADHPLNERSQSALVAMLELKAFESDSRVTATEITLKALGPASDPNAMKPVMSSLKSIGYVSSKRGSGGGYWLTPAGRARAEKLQNL